MLKWCKHIGTLTYHYKKGFYVDIVTDKECYNAWVYHENVGDKHHMFGVMKNSMSFQEFVNLVEGNIEQHIKFIKKIYEEDFE